MIKKTIIMLIYIFFSLTLAITSIVEKNLGFDLGMQYILYFYAAFSLVVFLKFKHKSLLSLSYTILLLFTAMILELSTITDIAEIFFRTSLVYFCVFIVQSIFKK